MIFGLPFKTFELSGYTAIIIIHNRRLSYNEVKSTCNINGRM